MRDSALVRTTCLPILSLVFLVVILLHVWPPSPLAGLQVYFHSSVRNVSGIIAAHSHYTTVTTMDEPSRREECKWWRLGEFSGLCGSSTDILWFGAL